MSNIFILSDIIPTYEGYNIREVAEKIIREHYYPRDKEIAEDLVRRNRYVIGDLVTVNLTTSATE